MHETDTSKTVAYFLSFIGPNYSRSSTLFNFKSMQIEKKYLQVSSKQLRLIIQLTRLKRELEDSSAIVIMSPAHKITFLTKLISGKKVILDAGWPLTDGVISRGFKKSYFLNLIKAYILDFTSFHAADLVLAETIVQSTRIRKMFFLSRKKIKVSYTGLNENAFQVNKQETLIIQNLKTKLNMNPRAINVLFRGKVNNESGIDTIISSAQELKNETNFIFITGSNCTLNNLPANCFQLSDVSESEMAQIYELADVALGQISKHRRLKYTIPHKAFEAAYFAKCYLTPKSQGILEIFSQNECFFLNEVSLEELNSSLRALAKRAIREDFQNKISKVYHEKISQHMINSSFENMLMHYSK